MAAAAEAGALGAADVAVIGGGLVGCATAYHLARGGADVALIDRSDINREASGTNAGSLHLQIYIHPHFPEDWIERIRPSIPLLHESAKIWAGMEDELGTDCGIRLGGGLWVAETREEMALIERKVAAERAVGIGSMTMTRAELLERAPYLGAHVIGGSFFAGEGYANPLLVAPAHARAAVRHGARIFPHVAVLAIERDGARGFALATSRGSFRARQVVVAAGAWTAEVGRMVGVTLPVRGSAAQVGVTDGRPDIMRNQLLQHVGKGLTLKQFPQGSFVIGGGWPGHLDRRLGRKVPILDSIVGNAFVAQRTVPEIGRAELVRVWSGMGGGSSDGLPIIGESSAVRGFHVVYAPLGFTMGPVCGRVFAEHFLTGEASVPVAAFSPDRFREAA
jgi:glycine/D-amino acid oxidase-like deaminating enzyme